MQKKGRNAKNTCGVAYIIYAINDLYGVIPN